MMTRQEIIRYWENENLSQYLVAETKDERGVYDAVSGNVTDAIPPDVEDLVRIHKLIRTRMSFTVMEFGVGFSTIIIADALKKNKKDWEQLDPIPKIRNRFQFQSYSVDTSKEWIDKTKERIPEDLIPYTNFHYSTVSMGLHQGQMCHFYDSLPDIVPDFIYIDGPDPQAVQGSINGMTFQCQERTVMSGDLLLMEPILIPGTFVLLDGRTNNARFLKNNLKRTYKHNWDRDGDVTTFELIEERLGKYNILGSDYIPNKERTA